MIDKGVEYASSVHEVEFSTKQAIRTTAFWLLIIAAACHNLATPVISIHAIPFLTDIGIDFILASGIMAIMLGVGIPFRFIGGMIADRLDKRRMRFIIVISYSIQAAGFAFYLLNQTTTMVYVFFILYGIGTGLAYAFNTLIVARYFGRKAFGSIYGMIQLIITPVGVLAPVYAGWTWDTTGSYVGVFSLVAILLAISGVLISFARPPKLPTHSTNNRQIV
jgi:MFS family permease